MNEQYLMQGIEWRNAIKAREQAIRVIDKALNKEGEGSWFDHKADYQSTALEHELVLQFVPHEMISEFLEDVKAVISFQLEEAKKNFEAL